MTENGNFFVNIRRVPYLKGAPDSGDRRPACKCFHLLDGFVEPFTELTADGRIKTDLMQEFKPRVFVIANRPHR